MREAVCIGEAHDELGGVAAIMVLEEGYAPKRRGCMERERSGNYNRGLRKLR